MAKSFQTDIILAGKVNPSLQSAFSKVQKSASNIQKTAAKMGKAFVLAGTVAATAVAGISVASVKNAGEFQNQMANVETLLVGTQAEVQNKVAKYSDVVKGMATDTGTETSVLTDGLYQVISAYGDVADSTKILDVANKAAIAGNVEVTDAVNLLSAVTKGYGDTSAEANKKAADLAFATVRLGQTTFPDLAASMGKAIPLAVTMGAKQEDLFGAMATLTGVTGNAAEVSTQLRGTMQGFIQPTDAMTKSIKSLGYASGKEMIQSLGLQGTLEKLKASVGGNEMAFANLFGSIEAKNAVLALTGAQAQNFAEKTAGMYDAIGESEKAYEVKAKTFTQTLERVKQKVNVMSINLGEKLLPIAEKLIDVVDPAISAISTLLGGDFDGFMEQAVDIMAALGLSDSTIASVTEIIETIKNAFLSVKQTIQNVWNDINWDGIIGLISNIIKTVLPPLVQLASRIIPAIMKAVKALLPVLSVVIDVVGTIIDALLPVLLPFIEKIGNLFTALAPAISTVAGLIGTLLTSAIQNFMPFIEALIQRLGGIIDFLTGVFTGNWQLAWDGIKNIIQGTFKQIVSFVLYPIATIISGINTAITGANKLGEKVGITIPTIPQIPGYAAGGTITKPTLAYVAEKPGLTETIVPHTTDARSQSLALRAAQATGIMERLRNDGGNGSVLQRGVEAVQGKVSNQKIEVTFAPVIHTNGSKEETKQALDIAEIEFEDRIRKFFRKERMVTV